MILHIHLTPITTTPIITLHIYARFVILLLPKADMTLISICLPASLRSYPSPYRLLVADVVYVAFGTAIAVLRALRRWGQAYKAAIQR
jgi:hypothetical protein